MGRQTEPRHTGQHHPATSCDHLEHSYLRVVCLLFSNPLRYPDLRLVDIISAPRMGNSRGRDPKELGLDPDGVMDVEGVTGTFEELREELHPRMGYACHLGRQQAPGPDRSAKAGVDRHLGFHAG